MNFVKINNREYADNGIIVVNDKLFFRFIKDFSIKEGVIKHRSLMKYDKVEIEEYKGKLTPIKECKLIPIILNEEDKEDQILIDEDDVISSLIGIPINKDELYKYRDFYIKFTKIKDYKEGVCYVLDSSTSFTQVDNIFKDGFTLETLRDRIGGYDEVFQMIYEKMLMPRMVSKNLRNKYGESSEKGILIDGPSGCGKTLFARIMSEFIECEKLIIVNGPSLLSSYIGQSEENVRIIFDEIKENKGKFYIIFFDEIDSVACKRSSNDSSMSAVNTNIVNSLLTQIDGIEQFNNFIIIAATNRPDIIDEAILRSGRIGLRCTIELPDEKSRRQILNSVMKKIDVKYDINKLISLSEGFTGSEIASAAKSIINKSLFSNYDPNNLNKRIDVLNIEEDVIYQCFRDINPMYSEKIEVSDEYNLEQFDKINELIENGENLICVKDLDINVYSHLSKNFKGNKKLLRDENVKDLVYRMLVIKNCLLFIPSFERLIGYNSLTGITKSGNLNDFIDVCNIKLSKNKRMTIVIGVDNIDFFDKLKIGYKYVS